MHNHAVLIRNWMCSVCVCKCKCYIVNIRGFVYFVFGERLYKQPVFTVLEVMLVILLIMMPEECNEKQHKCYELISGKLKIANLLNMTNYLNTFLNVSYLMGNMYPHPPVHRTANTTPHQPSKTVDLGETLVLTNKPLYSTLCRIKIWSIWLDCVNLFHYFTLIT